MAEKFDFYSAFPYNEPSMFNRSHFSHSWFRHVAILLTSGISFYLLMTQFPRLFSETPANATARQAQLTQTLSAVSPHEILVIKRSGQTAAPSEDTPQLVVPSPEPTLPIRTAMRIDHARSSTIPAPDLDSPKKSHHLLSADFSIPLIIQPMVEFWKKVFAVYGRRQVVLHHRDHLDLTYAVLDFSPLDAPELGLSDDARKRLRSRMVELERQAVLTDLRQQAADSAHFSPASREILVNSDLLRSQTGIAERFGQAIAVSGRYMPYMEDIFHNAGLPTELTRLPFIESSFDLRATSSVGAAGIWQFMEETGRLYLRVDALIDERRDPILATAAAAKFFQKMHGALGSWPLAVNGYNTGHGRMLQAINALGTKDIGEIIRNFVHPTYQFASRNFYPEFIAALEIYEARDKYFPAIVLDAPIRYDIITPMKPILLPRLADSMQIPIDTLRDLNPALSFALFEGKKLLPASIDLRVPYLMGDKFGSALTALERLPQIASDADSHPGEQGSAHE